MKGSLLMVERDPVLLPWLRSEGVLIGGKFALSGDDEVVAVRECNDDIERGISAMFEGLLLEGESKRWTGVDKELNPKGCASCCGKRQRGRSDHHIEQVTGEQGQ
jgi:hypothetical protein